MTGADMLAYAKPYPGAVGVYRLRDADDRLLYVGLGWSPVARWRTHAKKASWWPHVVGKEIEWFRTYAAASRAEKLAIHNERPIHNVVRVDPSGLPDLVDEDGDELTIGEFRQNMTEVVTRCRLLRSSVRLTNRESTVAVVIPAELGLLIRRVGGIDRAAEIIQAHLGS
jgi:hypothetical protein